MAWASAPRGVRLPTHDLRLTTAGRIACSAGQLVASTSSRSKKTNRSFWWRLKCLAKRRAGEVFDHLVGIETGRVDRNLVL